MYREFGGLENLLNSWLSVEIFLGCVPMLTVRGNEGTPGTHLGGDLSLSSKVCLVAHQSNHDFVGKESLLQLLQPQLCSTECLLERWRQNHPVIWFWFNPFASDQAGWVAPNQRGRRGFDCPSQGNVTSPQTHFGDKSALDGIHGGRNHAWVVAWSCQGPYLVSNVINEEGSVGIAVVEVTDTLVLLLACRVPDLKLDSGLLQAECLSEEGACRQDEGVCSPGAAAGSSDPLHCGQTHPEGC